MPAGLLGPSGRSVIANAIGDSGAEALAPLSRLALAYAPAPAKADWLTFLLLDARLGQIVRSAREPMLAQLKLAWWRDRLSGGRAAFPRGEPLLARLADWLEPASMVPLVDGWEALLGEPPLGPEACRAFAEGRGQALVGLAKRMGTGPGLVATVGQCWSLAEIAVALGSDEERAAALTLLAAERNRVGALPRVMRPLAVLAGVYRRASAKEGLADLHNPGAWLTAVRIGLTGR